MTSQKVVASQASPAPGGDGARVRAPGGAGLPGHPELDTPTGPGLLGPAAQWLEWALIGLTLIVLLVYAYGLLIALPYAGFDNVSRTGLIETVFDPQPAGVRLGDRIVAIDGVPYSAFVTDLRRPFWPDPATTPSVRLTVDRTGQTLTVTQTLQRFAPLEFTGRLLSQWWLAWVFALAAIATVLLVRANDRRRLLLTAFLCLVAVWLGASSLSRWNLWESAICLRASTWLLAITALHLHWIFPTPLGRLPGWLGWAGYALASLLAILELGQFVPRDAYGLGFALTALAVVLLVTVRWVRPGPGGVRPPSLFVLTWAGLATFVPAAVLAVINLFGAGTSPALLGLIGLPLLPAGYVLAALRGQLEGIQVRANRLISAYLYAVAILVLTGLVHLAVGPGSSVNLPAQVFWFVWVTLMVLATLALYPRVQRWIERHALRMPVPPETLLETLAGRLVACPDVPRLIAVLRDEVWLAMLVKQWALVRLGDSHQAELLHAELAPQAQTLSAVDWHALQHHPHPALRPGAEWMRLVLPLAVNAEPVGVLALGRRDPDDLYAAGELPALHALANQTAIALAHIVQTGRLRAFFQANIDRHETERADLARELHDDILNELGRLRSGQLGADADTTYGHVIDSVRGMISGLRPAALNFGLQVALEQLADDLSARGPMPVEVRFPGEADAVRYEAAVEQQLFRIVQQAAENALKHAAPTRVVIAADLQADQATLTIHDDGRGLPVDLATDLSALLDHRHFGLAGMHERAALIGARVSIAAETPHGTRVSVTWSAPPAQ